MTSLHRLALFAAVALAATSVPAGANKLAAANSEQILGKTGLRAKPPIDWNKLNAKPGPDAETWTLDGELLNSVTFYSGVPSGKPLAREIDRKNRPLPKFASSMLLPDIPSLLERTYRVTQNVNTFDTSAVVPMTFAGHPGVQFTYEFIGADDVRRRGETTAAIVNGKLFMVSYEAPTLHYYEDSLAKARSLIQTVTIAK